MRTFAKRAELRPHVWLRGPRPDLRILRRCKAGRMPTAVPGEKRTIVFDVMDTIVKDPFFQRMPAYFNMSFKELLAAKHPKTWIHFEQGDIGEEELFAKFFLDERSFDGEGLKEHMVDSFCYIDGMRDLLVKLKAAGYSMHAMTNYPVWYKLIESKLKLSDVLPWTFVSCEGAMKGLRKPAREAFQCLMDVLQLSPNEIIFIDDRKVNVDAACQMGLHGLLYTDTATLNDDLAKLDIQY